MKTNDTKTLGPAGKLVIFENDILHLSLDHQHGSIKSIGSPWDLDDDLLVEIWLDLVRLRRQQEAEHMAANSRRSQFRLVR